jgi:hypothetical protein
MLFSFILENCENLEAIDINDNFVYTNAAKELAALL